MVAWSRHERSLGSGVVRAFTGPISDALLGRLAAALVQMLRRFQYGARERDPSSPSSTPSLLDHLPGDAVLLIDGQAVIVRLGRNVGRVLGWSNALPVGTTVLDHLHPDDRDTARRAWTDDVARRTGTADPDSRVRVRFAAPESGWRWFEVVGRDLRANAEVGAIVLTLRDIDREVEAVNEALETERALLCLVDASNSGIFRFDREGTVVYANSRWEEITGVPADEVT